MNSFHSFVFSDLIFQWKAILTLLQCRRFFVGATFWNPQTGGGLPRPPLPALTMCRFDFRKHQFWPNFDFFGTSGRCPPLQSLVSAQCFAEGVDRDDKHSQLDKILQPQPQAGGAGQTAGIAPLLGKPPELEEENGPCLVGEGPRGWVALVVEVQPLQVFLIISFEPVQCAVALCRFPYWQGWPDPRNKQLLEAMKAKNVSGDFNVTKILSKSSSIYH